MNRCFSILLLGLLFLSYNKSKANNPTHCLVGYWHNWNDVNAPYIPLDQVDTRYTQINVAFAIPQAGTDYQMTFVPDQVSVATFKSQVQTLQALNKKVLISIGGATAPISLDNTMERDSFISTMTTIINTYDFDGIDIDFEGSSLMVSGGSIATPTDASVNNLINAINQIMQNFRASNGKKMQLTMAPETAFVQGGMSAFSGIWGAYLPVINALRDSMDLLHVQLYNSGTMYGIDGNIYTQGTADFIVAMTEAVIQGFNTAGGFFTGLPAYKVAIGLPACTSAAGGGFTASAIIKSAVDYLMGNGPQPGTYVLTNSSGYSDLCGLMTWSINWDAVATCGNAYEFASVYEDIFGLPNSIETPNHVSQYQITFNANTSLIYVDMPFFNEATNFALFNSLGQMVKGGELNMGINAIDISDLTKGMYIILCSNSQNSLPHKIMIQ